jgi:hypothetical protein
MIGQARDSGGAMLLVAFSNGNWIKILSNNPSGWALVFYLCNNTRATLCVAVHNRPKKIPRAVLRLCLRSNFIERFHPQKFSNFYSLTFNYCA